MKAAEIISDDERTRTQMQLVSFNLANEEYGVEVLKVKEIIRMPNITRVPNMPPHVAGVINLRGKVIPVIALRKKFNLPETANDSRTRIVVMETAAELTGFIVDSVAEVLRISATDIQPAPQVMTEVVEHECISGVINRENQLLVLLDLEKLFLRDEAQLFNIATDE